MNLWDILLLILIGVAVILALRKSLARGRGDCCSSCGGSCSCCANRGSKPMPDRKGAEHESENLPS